MASVPLSVRTINEYMGCDGRNFNSCHEISKISLVYDVDANYAKVQAKIPAASTRQGHYVISAYVRPDGSSILHTECTCPVGHKCKHIDKVLRRIANSPNDPIKGPSPAQMAEATRRRELARKMDFASVYIAFSCHSEFDSGSDYRMSYHLKDNFDQELLGVFFSKAEANRCAKNHVKYDIGYEDDMDDDEDEDEDGDSDDETFVWDESDLHLGESDNHYTTRVWVERRAIEDASARFHR